jgi:hypothetical protein
MTDQPSHAIDEPENPEEAVTYWCGRWARKASELADAVGIIHDLAQHATPIALDADGFVAAGYTVTVGAVHRAYAWLQQVSAGQPRSVETWDQYTRWLADLLRQDGDADA